jgi:hypothetical protein
VTFSLSIVLKSLEPKYLTANASWLAGALLTIVLDIYVLAQFAVFSWQDRVSQKQAELFVDESRNGPSEIDQ